MQHKDYYGLEPAFSNLKTIQKQQTQESKFLSDHETPR